MPDARSPGYLQVRSGLRLLLWTFGLSALLHVANRVASALLMTPPRARVARGLPAPYRGAPDAREWGEAGEAGEGGRRGAASGDAALWLDVGAGIRGYAGAIKARLGVLVGGYALLAAVGMSGETELARALLGLLPVATAVIGVIMLIFLARLLRVPAAVGCDGPALLGVILVLVSMLADLHACSLVLDMLGDRLYKAIDARERMPYVEAGSQALVVAAQMALLAAFRRIARFVGDEELAERCGLMVLELGWVLAAATLGRMMIGSALAGLVQEPALIVGLLVGAVVILVRYLGVLRDLQAAVDRYGYGGGGGGGGGGGDGPAAAAV